MEKVKEHFMTYQQAIDSRLWYNEEEFDELLRQERREEAKKETLISTIKGLLSNKVSDEIIKKSLNLTDKEYNNLLKEIN